MSSVEPSVRNRRLQIATVLFILGGTILIGLSFGLTNGSVGRLLWTDEQGQKYEAAAGALHRLSHSEGHESTGEQAAAHQKEMEQAQADYAELRKQLDTARARPQQWATIVRMIGILLAIVGATVYFAGTHK